MRLEELDAVCREAVRNLVAREGRPVPAAVVLPLPEATKVTTLPGFPDDDAARTELLERFAQDVMRPANAPCYGFIAEAVVHDEPTAVDVVLVAYGARGQLPRITAAPVTDDDIGEFGEAEELGHGALAFLLPLQRAADSAAPHNPAGLPGAEQQDGPEGHGRGAHPN